MIYLAIILAVIVGWKAGRSYGRGEGMIEGYEIGRRYEKKLTEPKEQGTFTVNVRKQ